MSARELHVLGTASQAPTRCRNQNGYLVRWQLHGTTPDVTLFDPGEGVQRQCIRYGISPADITRICLTHFHGDHCLGLPGMIQAIVNATQDYERELEIYYPASGEQFFQNLRYSCAYKTRKLKIIPRPMADEGIAFENKHLQMTARWLKHRMPTLGYRIEEKSKRVMDSEKLQDAGIKGLDVRTLLEGKLVRGDQTFFLDDFSSIRPGPSFAFVMDTVPCENAVVLGQDADLLVCESTYLNEDEAEAKKNGHMTALQAARIAVAANAKKLVLTHFSQRYFEIIDFQIEAQNLFESSVAVKDGDIIEF